MVNSLRYPALSRHGRRGRVVGKMATLAFLCLAAASNLPAQQPGVHFLHEGAMPPGAIGGQQLLRGGPLPGFFQPVEIKAPRGVSISLAVEGRFDRPHATKVKAGMLIGAVYRIAVMNVPLHEGFEVYPTIEVIDRLYAPRGMERRFPIPIELTQEDLELAISGKFVTRVIYLEDPRMALPTHEPGGVQNWFDAGPGKDPLTTADSMGRPVAILRLGGRIPNAAGQVDPGFLNFCPPLQQYPAEVEILPHPPVRVLPPPPPRPDRAT